MTVRHYKLITFDLDDTLWWVSPVIERANEKMFSWLAAHCPSVHSEYDVVGFLKLKEELLNQRPDLEHQISQIRIETLREAMLRCDFSEAQAIDFSQQAFAVFLQARQEVEPFAGVKQVLQQLKKHYCIGALTNGNADINRVGLGDYFDFAYTAEQLNASKPEPDLFHAAMNFAHVSEAEMIHVGDNPEHDIYAAARLGITTVWSNFHKVSWRELYPFEDRIFPSGEIHSIDQLPDCVALLEEKFVTASPSQ